MLKFLFAIAAAALVAVLGFVIDAQSRTPVVHPRLDPATLSIYAPGRVEGASPETELRPQLAGRVVRVLVADGDLVEEGQLLVELDESQYRCAVALAAAEVELAEAQLERLLNGAHHEERSEAAALFRAKQAELERARLAWKRLDELRQAQAISQQEADNQRTLVEALQGEVAAAKARLDHLEAAARPDDVRIAQARIAAARARWELAKVDLARCELRAPMRGEILDVGVEAGELSGPAAEEPAVVMADTISGPLRVRAFVEELDAPRVKIGMTAAVTADGLPGRQFRGRVVRLSPRMGRKQIWSDRPTERFDTKTREVWIELDSGEGLVVGLPVDVVIEPKAGDVVDYRSPEETR